MQRQPISSRPFSSRPTALSAASPEPTARSTPDSATRTCIKEVVCAASIERGSEEIGEDEHLERVGPAEHRADVKVHVLPLAETRDGLDGQNDRVEDAGHLRVLVDEGESVGYVVIAEMNDRTADPVTELNNEEKGRIGKKKKNSKQVKHTA